MDRCSTNPRATGVMPSYMLESPPKYEAPSHCPSAPDNVYMDLDSLPSNGVPMANGNPAAMATYDTPIPVTKGNPPLATYDNHAMTTIDDERTTVTNSNRNTVTYDNPVSSTDGKAASFGATKTPSPVYMDMELQTPVYDNSEKF